MAQDFENALRANAWFAALPPNLQGILTRRFEEYQIPDGGKILGVGSPPDGLRTVVDGQVRLTTDSQGSRRLVGPGEWFGVTAAIDGRPQPLSAFAIGRTRLLHVSQERLNFATTSEPALFKHFAQLLADELRRMEAANHLDKDLPLHVRVARALVGLSEEFASSEFQVRQAEIAKLVGVTRQTVSGGLKRLEKAGVISLSYGRVTILNVKHLVVVAKSAA